MYVGGYHRGYSTELRYWAYICTLCASSSYQKEGWLVALLSVVERKMNCNGSLTSTYILYSTLLSRVSNSLTVPFFFFFFSFRSSFFLLSHINLIYSTAPPCLVRLVDAASLPRLSSTSSPISICLGRTSVGREYLDFFRLNYSGATGSSTYLHTHSRLCMQRFYLGCTLLEPAVTLVVRVRSGALYLHTAIYSCATPESR